MNLPYNDSPLEVWLDNGNVHRVQIHPSVGTYRILDTKGMHPLMNAIVDGDRIQAWRPCV